MNGPQNIVEHNGGGGLVLPSHITESKKAQEQFIADMAQEGYRDAYRETLGKLENPVMMLQQKLQMASTFLGSALQNQSGGNMLKNVDRHHMFVAQAMSLAACFTDRAQDEIEGLKYELAHGGIKEDAEEAAQLARSDAASSQAAREEAEAHPPTEAQPEAAEEVAHG